MLSWKKPKVMICSALSCLVLSPAEAQTVGKKTTNVGKIDSILMDSQAAEHMAQVRRQLDSGQLVQAENQLKLARPMISDPLIRIVWNSLALELFEAKGEWVEAAVHGGYALREYASVIGNDSKNSSFQWNSTVRNLFFRTLRNSMKAGFVVESLSLFLSRKNDISRDLLLSEEELTLKRLADELRRVDRLTEAESIESIVFKNYPFVSDALRESLTPDTVCRLDEKLSSLADKKQKATSLVQRLGAQDDLRNFVLSLMGLPVALRMIELPADSLTGQARTELLDLVEWLNSVREYNFAYSITNKLISSQNFEPPFTRDRLIMLHARNLNGVHRPVEAAAFYRGLILQYPETDIANTARPRYVLSLHYAQKYTEVAREAATLSGLLRSRDVAWRTFWARYLSKQFSVALATSEHESGQEQRARFQYWRGRAYESDGLHSDAKEVFKKVLLADSPSHYGLLASWRLSPVQAQSTEVPKGKISFAAKRLVSIDTSAAPLSGAKERISARYSHYETLIDAGFGGLLRGPLRRRLLTLGPSGTDLAVLLKRAGDANAGVQFAVSQRKVRGQYPHGRSKEWKTFVTKNLETIKLLYPVPYGDLVDEAAEFNRISPWLILSIMRAESLFQPQVVSSVGARGLMQIMPTSGARIAEFLEYPEFEPAHLDQPEVSIAFGAWYLARLLKYYSGNLLLAIAAYNAGPEAIDRWLKRNPGMSLDEFLEDIPFDQTRKYVSTVLTNMETYSRLYSGGARGISVSLSENLPSPRNDLEIF